MFKDLVREAIREPSSTNAASIMDESIPTEVHGFIPDLVAQLDQGVDSEVVADQALNKTFDIVESAVLSDATTHVLDKFSDRITNLLFGEPFLKLLEQAAALVVNIPT
jgi:hypothetical protein